MSADMATSESTHLPTDCETGIWVLYECAIVHAVATNLTDGQSALLKSIADRQGECVHGFGLKVAVNARYWHKWAVCVITSMPQTNSNQTSHDVENVEPYPCPHAHR